MTHGGYVLAGPVDLNAPGRYVHWSIFTVSVSNLVLIAVMVIIFGLALTLPFPKGRRRADGDTAELGASSLSEREARTAKGDPADADMWTARIRRRILGVFPPEKLLPDRQPAYVASWIYVFGVGSLAALAVVVLSGFALALGGSDWWHTNPVGHFFNSLHLWSVELFMALLVIHLWGKFWMAAWRGRRAWTWITGVVAFTASVVEAFTGYLSQQNFDSQWIATNGKDAFNAVGVGSVFALMNFGQMLMWHIVLMPVVLVAIIGAHVLLVRARGVAHPLGKTRPASGGNRLTVRRALSALEAAPWRGPTRRYDIVKEGSIAAIVVLILVVALAGVLSSPDEPPVTIQSWAQVAPADFLGTAASELAGTSVSSNYGPPYNNGTGSVQRLWFSWQTLIGVTQPVDPANDFVLSPLAKIASTDPALADALSVYRRAPSSQQQAWDQAYMKVLANVSFLGAAVVVPKADDGPVPVLVSTELTLARSGALDADLIARHDFYGTNLTEPLLFLADGGYYADKAKAEHLTGNQWGVLNETGSYPGQPWLWLYQLWYEVPGFRSSTNVDMIAIYMTGVATILLLAVPFLPGLRDIPRIIPIHRLIWRSWYADQDALADDEASSA